MPRNVTNATPSGNGHGTTQQPREAGNAPPASSQAASDEETVTGEIDGNGAEVAENAPPDDPAHGDGGKLQAAGPIFSATPRQGHVSPPPGEVMKDQRLIARALREGWDIPVGTSSGLPRGLVEIFCRRQPVAPGKKAAKGEMKYAYRPAARLKAAELLIKMREANIVLATHGGDSGEEIDAQASTRMLEQARRNGELVITDAEIQEIIDAESSSAPAESNGDGKPAT